MQKHPDCELLRSVPYNKQVELLKQAYDSVVFGLSKEELDKLPFNDVLKQSLDHINRPPEQKLVYKKRTHDGHYISPPVFQLADRPKDECSMKKVSVAVDVLGIILGLAGISNEIAQRASQELMQMLPMVGIERIVLGFTSASTVWEYASLTGQVAGHCWNYFSVSAILKAISHEFEWYDWIIMGINITATITLLFGTASVGLAAKIALNTSSILQLTEDVVKMKEVCGLNCAK